MYRFGTKKNREDIIALRWPNACLSCGIEISDEISPQYAILGEFYEEKDTQVLIKMPGFFYICNDCILIISDAKMKDDSKELARKLEKHPWKEFLELERNGTLKLHEGEFKRKLQKLNPEGKFESIDNPLDSIQ